MKVKSPPRPLSFGLFVRKCGRFGNAVRDSMVHPLHLGGMLTWPRQQRKHSYAARLGTSHNILKGEKHHHKQHREDDGEEHERETSIDEKCYCNVAFGFRHMRRRILALRARVTQHSGHRCLASRWLDQVGEYCGRQWAVDVHAVS